MTALALTALMLGFTVTHDDDDFPVVWESLPVTIAIQEDGSGDIDDGSDLAVIREALATWSTGCSGFEFEEARDLFVGLAYDWDGQTSDGVNTISFIDDPADWPPWAGAAIGFAPEVIEERDAAPDVRTEVDVILNGNAVTGDGDPIAWATDGTPDRLDVGGVVTHELGHALGLWHSSDTDATMYFGSKPGGTQARVLGVDDIRGLCFLYPASTFACVEDADCPVYFDAGGGGRMVCDLGACVDGVAGYGLDCTDPAHCTSGVCIAARYVPGTNPGFCSQGCNVHGQNCPTGFCSEYSGVPLCYPHREDCVLDRETEADECGAPSEPWECVWDWDLVQRCLHVCTSESDCASLPGTICHGGYCRTPGATAVGDPCSHNGECESLQCGGLGPVCQSPPPEPDGGPTDGGRDGGEPLPDDGGAAGDDLWVGDPFFGDPWAGDPASGDAGDPLAGDPLAGDPRLGDPRGDDPFLGDPLVGDPVVGDPVVGDPAMGDLLAGDFLAGDLLAGDSLAGDLVADGSGDPVHEGAPPRVRGAAAGCACAESGGGGVVVAVLGLLRRRRRIRTIRAGAGSRAGGA